jgi:hypothetical protein
LLHTALFLDVFIKDRAYMINEKLQKAEELGMESFPCPIGLLLGDFKSNLVCYWIEL